MAEENTTKKEPVVNSTAHVVKKSSVIDRFAKLFMSEDLDSAGKHVSQKARDILKNSVYEFVMDMIDAYFFDGASPKKGSRIGQPGYRTNYSTTIQKKNTVSTNRETNTTASTDSRTGGLAINVGTLVDAKELKSHILEDFETYGRAKVSDVLEYAGLQTDFAQQGWGWDESSPLTDENIRYSRDLSGGYIVKFPPTVKLK